MLKQIGIFLGLVVAVALLFFGYQQYGDWQVARLERWKADSTRVANVTRDAERAAAAATIKYDTTRLTYTRYRDRVVSGGVVTARDSATFAMCNAVVSACEERHAADSVVIAAKDRELAIARARPTEKAKRIELRVGGFYDIARASPLFRTDANVRLIGPISVAGEGEIAIPPASQCVAMGTCGVTMSVRVGVWYKF